MRICDWSLDVCSSDLAFRELPAAEWIEPLAANGVPVGLIKTVPEALSDAKESGRGMIMALSGDDGAAIGVVGNPIKFVGEQEVAGRYPPELGADAYDVLNTWLELDSADIAQLVDGKVVIVHDGAES